ncbi:hypothetical protein B0T24DRAFT_636934 [Lasiosphaeria ovina]|uniref:Uncharacterized protein n=1 Tax=Lasiosphaeria ovina TaxID=92902 RepID=A0AAE0N055_9PEZI|nr:hypothetical protein B0T24DRAFT_636934 [Lasiosphaeria ovina]
MEPQSFDLLQWEELCAVPRAAGFFAMNWTEGKLYRSTRGRLRKANPARQRQREYFANARARAAEVKNSVENGPPSISFLRSSSSLSRRSRASNKSVSSAERHASQPATQKQADPPRKRPKITDTARESPLPTISRFFEQQSAQGIGAPGPVDTQPEYDGQALERMRQKLLAKKDWRLSRRSISGPAKNRPKQVSDSQASGNKTSGEAIQDVQKRASHIARGGHGHLKRRHEPLSRQDMVVRIGSQEGRAEAPPRGNSTDNPDFDAIFRERPPLGSLPLSSSQIAGENPRREERLISGRMEPCVISTPEIREPVPLRAFPTTFYPMETFDSANTDSVLVQVGRVASPVPPSRKGENDRWRKWLRKPSSPINSVEAVEGSQESVECPRVSPGVSEISREVRERSQSLPRLTDAALSRFTGTKPSEVEALGQAFGSSSSSLILSRFEDLMARIHRRHEQTGTQKEAPPLDSQMHIPDDDPTPHEKDGNMQANVSRQIPPTAAEQIGAPLCKSDPDQAWKSFLFGGESTDGVEEAAFDEAKRDVARDLQPSTYSSCIGDNPLSEWDSNIAAAGTAHTNRDESSGFANDVLSSAGASASRKATLGPSSTGVMSDPTSAGQDGDDQYAESSLAPLVQHGPNLLDTPCPDPTKSTGGSMSDTLAHPAMSTISLAVEPARSEVGVNDQFRFIPPKLFVGSRSSLKRPNEAPMPVTVGNRRGRRKIRARDGRANIRALPNYNSDPIEDIEDVGETRPSLFGSLDLA